MPRSFSLRIVRFPERESSISLGHIHPEIFPQRDMTLPDLPDAPGVELQAGEIRFAEHVIFEDLALNLAGGKITALLGESGCGKTSLLRLLAGLPPPPHQKDIVWHGEVRLDNDLPRAGNITLMEQSNPLLPWASALENITIGARLRGEPPDNKRAHDLLDTLGLGARAQARITTFSGGMKQRVSLARALYEPCPVVLMDEPFAALDAITRWRLQRKAVELLAGRSCLLVTHDPLEALRMGDEILLLKGTPARLERVPTPSQPPPRRLDSHEQQELHAKLLARMVATT